MSLEKIMNKETEKGKGLLLNPPKKTQRKKPFETNLQAYGYVM